MCGLEFDGLRMNTTAPAAQAISRHFTIVGRSIGYPIKANGRGPI
jgi:hypothetical protein